MKFRIDTQTHIDEDPRGLINPLRFGNVMYYIFIYTYNI